MVTWVRVQERGHDAATPSPYAVAKLAGEHYCQAFTSVYGLRPSRCATSTCWPRQDRSTYAADPKFITAMFKGEAPRVEGDGTSRATSRMWITSCTATCWRAIPMGSQGETFNIALVAGSTR